jgi:hypothetical protein
MAARQRFEHYASRVNCFLFAGLIVWQILHGRALILAFYLIPLVRMALSGFDFPRERGWWLGLAYFTVGFALLLWWLLSDRSPSRDRLVLLILTASMGSEALLLLLGRFRGVWAFCRTRRR